MSLSSPEQRPFISKPSPLLAEARAPIITPKHSSLRMNNSQHHPAIRVARTSNSQFGRDQGFRTIPLDSNTESRRSRDPGNIAPSSIRNVSRRRHVNAPASSEKNRSRSRGRSRGTKPRIEHRSEEIASARHPNSSAQFRPAGLDDLVDVPDIHSTLNPGSFSAPGRREVNNIMDRSQSPAYDTLQRQRSNPTGTSVRGNNGRGRSGGRGPHGDGSETQESVAGPLGAETADANQAIAKTFVRPEPPIDLLEYPVVFNPRVTMMVVIMHPLYIGGGCVDGRLNVHIRGTRIDDIRLGRVSIDIAGIEELSFSRKAMFMSIASELIDEDHPPPAAMLAPVEDEQKMFWKVRPSRSFFPFRLNLPLNVGPGPFNSVRARIRYVIHGTIMVSINGAKSIVRCSRDIRIISALDPETALLPLEIPLLSTEEHTLRYGGHKTLKVTAGLHRAVWIAGTAAYVDVNITNNTNRKVKSIKCKLRRHILAYKNVRVSI